MRYLSLNSCPKHSSMLRITEFSGSFFLKTSKKISGFLWSLFNFQGPCALRACPAAEFYITTSATFCQPFFAFFSKNFSASNVGSRRIFYAFSIFVFRCSIVRFFKAPDYNTKFPSLCQPLFLIFFRFFSYSDILISPRAFTSIYSMLYRLKCYCVSWHLMRYLPSRILLCRFLSARRKKEPGIATWKIAIPGGLFICFS